MAHNAPSLPPEKNCETRLSQPWVGTFVENIERIRPRIWSRVSFFHTSSVEEMASLVVLQLGTPGVLKAGPESAHKLDLLVRTQLPGSLHSECSNTYTSIKTRATNSRQADKRKGDKGCCLSLPSREEITSANFAWATHQHSRFLRPWEKVRRESWVPLLIIRCWRGQLESFSRLISKSSATQQGLAS